MIQAIVMYIYEETISRTVYIFC